MKKSVKRRVLLFMKTDIAYNQRDDFGQCIVIFILKDSLGFHLVCGKTA